MGSDGRPKLAVGHVSIEVDDVDGAYAFFVRHGMRDIFRGENFGVLELRGGTHLVVSQARQAVESGTGAPFDLMVDDIDAAHDEFTAAGVTATDIKRGRIHDTFHIDGPGGYRFAVTSSHAGDRVVSDPDFPPRACGWIVLNGIRSMTIVAARGGRDLCSPQRSRVEVVDHGASSNGSPVICRTGDSGQALHHRRIPA